MKKIIDKIMLRMGYEPIRPHPPLIARQQAKVAYVNLNISYELSSNEEKRTYFKKQALLRGIDKLINLTEWKEVEDKSYYIPVTRLYGTLRIVDPSTTETVLEYAQ